MLKNDDIFIHNSKMTTSIINRIPIRYSTEDYKISFNLKFGLGIDSAIEPDHDKRTIITNSYDIEKIVNNEQTGYRVIAHEGPLVIEVSDVNISNDMYDRTHTYALGVVFDMKKPEYDTKASIKPNNIERDGIMWNIPIDSDDTTHCFDQNAKANYQIVLKRAMDTDYKPTDKEILMGLEETTYTTGLMYITFMVFNKQKEIYTHSLYRGGGATRGATRGGNSSSDPARIGYGNSASTSSTQSPYKYAEHTEKFILPIRYRIDKNSKTSNINCASNMASAMHVAELNKMTMEVPF